MLSNVVEYLGGLGIFGWVRKSVIVDSCRALAVLTRYDVNALFEVSSVREGFIDHVHDCFALWSIEVMWTKVVFTNVDLKNRGLGNQGQGPNGVWGWRRRLTFSRPASAFWDFLLLSPYALPKSPGQVFDLYESIRSLV